MLHKSHVCVCIAVLVIVLLVTWNFDTHPFAYHSLQNGRMQIDRESRHAIFAQQLYETGKRLDRLNVPWMIYFGTLLGWYREQNFIEHDDDVDIVAFVEDAPKIIKALQDTNYIILDRVFGTGRIMVVDKDSGIQLDIFLFEKTRGGNYRQTSILGRFGYPGHGKTLYPSEWIFPLHRHHLQGINVNVPNQPRKILEDRYGSDFMTPKVETKSTMNFIKKSLQ